jgi:geranylgeranyl diphosphate synthase, type II
LSARALGVPRRRGARAGASSSPAPSRGRASDPLHARLRAFERYFAAAFERRCRAPGALGEAIRYAALSPGKRVRPLLALTSAEAVGGAWRTALPAAAAVECVHAFSLVHDDLPAMDNDDFRRGRLSTHKRYGEALGILAGDALLAFAFEEMARLLVAGVDPKRVVLAITWLARACGPEQLVAGQALDIAAEGRRVSEAQVRDIHARKTGAMIGVSMAIGGYVAGGSLEQAAALRSAGEDLGLAFQIHDDLLNAGSSLRRLGKRAGTDAAHRKATYPGAVGAEAAHIAAETLVATAATILHEHGLLHPQLARLIQALARRES